MKGVVEISKLIYELVKEYDNFKLWNVFINRPVNGNMRKVFLYQTTTHKIKPQLNAELIKFRKKKKRKEILWIEQN